MRRRKITKRVLIPDVKYNSELVARLINTIMRNGKIGSIDRFTIYISNQLPRAAAGKGFTNPEDNDRTGTVAGAPKRHIIWAGTKTGISFASQITKMEHLQNPNDFGQLVRGLQVWGSQVTQGQCLAPMIVASK